MNSFASNQASITLQTFLHSGDLYLRVIPSKALFRSSMIHEVVNRGDIFAIRLRDSLLTIIPGTSTPVHLTSSLATIMPAPAPADPASYTKQDELPL